KKKVCIHTRTQLDFSTDRNPTYLRESGLLVDLTFNRDEFELERDRWRRRPGERDLRRTGDTKGQVCYLLLMRGGVRRHIGGGGGILRGGVSLRGGGRTVGASTAVAVISCPAFSASSGVSNST
uniref:Uncharacterized protein n=1 Tax=Myripristis murdjan TaxID=586833 RepID=A0A667Y6P3_9TELE